MTLPFDRRKPFVGLGGTRNTLSVTRSGTRIICRVSSPVHWVVLLATAGFGPGMLALLWFRPAGTVDLSRLPIWLAALLLILPIASSVLFVYYLFNRHRFEVDRGSGDILFFRRRGARPIVTLRREQIEGFAIGEEWYTPDDGEPTKNYVLSAIAMGGTEVALCLSTSEPLIRSLADDLETLTGRSVTHRR